MPDKIWTIEEFKKQSNLGLFHRRANVYLAHIDTLLQHYKIITLETPDLEANLLLMICDACQKYYHRKPANHRAAAVMILHDQALKRAKALTLQLVTGDSSGHGLRGWAKVRAAVKPFVVGITGKTHHRLHQDYWQEALIPGHFPLARAIAYSKDPLSIWKTSSSPLSFLDWLREFYIPDMFDNKKGEELLRRLQMGVTYLDSAQREDKKIYINNGIIYNSRGERFHTGNMSTNIAGEGWAIFVMAPNNSLYANDHRVDIFHHSSFLSGAPVQAAGEIAVNNGILVGITCKSGHYRPNAASFVRILFWLKQHGAQLQGVAACPVISNHIQEFFDAEEVLLNGGKKGTKNIKPCKVYPSDM